MIDQAPEALVIPLSNSPGQGWKQHYPERHPDQADRHLQGGEGHRVDGQRPVPRHARGKERIHQEDELRYAQP